MDWNSVVAQVLLAASAVFAFVYAFGKETFETAKRSVKTLGLAAAAFVSAWLVAATGWLDKL